MQPQHAHIDDVFRQPINLPGLGGSPLVQFGEYVLRGVGQVVFQDNWLTGALILAAIFYNSWVYGLACLVGTVVSTLAALLLKADRGLITSGLFGFNGALTAIGLNAYLSPDFASGRFPDASLFFFIVFGAAFSSIAFAAIGSLLGPYRVPALTAPFVLTGWLFIFAVGQFGNFHPGPSLTATLPHTFDGLTHYTWTTWYQGAGKGVAEIFFQDNWVTGFLIVVAIAVNSRISAAMALGGSVLAMATAMLLGADEQDVRLGLYGFNAALTAMALGGIFYLLTARSLAYAALGVVVATWVSAAVAVALAPVGMPTFTAAFVIVTWLMLFAKDGFGALTAIPLAEVATPEINLARWRQRAALASTEATAAAESLASTASSATDVDKSPGPV